MFGVSFSKIRSADKWLVMIAVTIGMFMSLMDSTIVNVAIPQMQYTFGVGLQEIHQARSQHYAFSLAGQEFSGEILNRQSALLGMHESFLLAACLALVAMGFVPRREKQPEIQVDQTSIVEMRVS
jgi:hypothetical protein